MTLAGLSARNRQVLQVLRERQAANRKEIAHASQGLDADQISSVLNRLEAFGFVDRPKHRASMAWTITAAGLALFGEAPPAPSDPAPNLDDEWDDEEISMKTNPLVMESHEPIVAAPGVPPQTPAPLLAQRELDEAMDTLVARLRAPVIPAQSARVYRRLVAALPDPVRAALEPITALVES